MQRILAAGVLRGCAQGSETTRAERSKGQQHGRQRGVNGAFASSFAGSVSSG